MAKREGIKPPKFAGEFAVCDFEAEPMPVLSLYAPPPPRPLDDWRMTLVDARGRRFEAGRKHLAVLPRVRERRPFICQIFHWRETVEWEGVRLVDLLDLLTTPPPRTPRLPAPLDPPPHDSYLTFYAADGRYFETLPQAMARDPRVLLAFGMNGAPLPHAHGGPVRLVVPFLQGYKSVKWLDRVHVHPEDPLGTKRLLGQSRSAYLTGAEWQEMAETVTVLPSREGALAEV